MIEISFELSILYNNLHSQTRVQAFFKENYAIIMKNKDKVKTSFEEITFK